MGRQHMENGLTYENMRLGWKRCSLPLRAALLALPPLFSAFYIWQVEMWLVADKAVMTALAQYIGVGTVFLRYTEVLMAVSSLLLLAMVLAAMGQNQDSKS